MKSQTMLIISGLLTFIAFIFYCNEEWFSSTKTADTFYSTFALVGNTMVCWAYLKYRNRRNNSVFSTLYFVCVMASLLVLIVQFSGYIGSRIMTDDVFGDEYMFFSCLIYFFIAGDSALETNSEKNALDSEVHSMD